MLFKEKIKAFKNYYRSDRLYAFLSEIIVIAKIIKGIKIDGKTVLINK